jgi:hypothetical protein
VARRRAHLLASACLGRESEARSPQLRAMLRAGVFDVALQRAHLEAVALATSMGWITALSESRVARRRGDQRDMAPD